MNHMLAFHNLTQFVSPLASSIFAYCRPLGLSVRSVRGRVTYVCAFVVTYRRSVKEDGDRDAMWFFVIS